MSFNIRPKTIQTSEAAPSYSLPPPVFRLAPLNSSLFPEEIVSAPRLEGRIFLFEGSDKAPTVDRVFQKTVVNPKAKAFEENPNIFKIDIFNIGISENELARIFASLDEEDPIPSFDPSLNRPPKRMECFSDLSSHNACSMRKNEETDEDCVVGENIHHASASYSPGQAEQDEESEASSVVEESARVLASDDDNPIQERSVNSKKRQPSTEPAYMGRKKSSQRKAEEPETSKEKKRKANLRYKETLEQNPDKKAAFLAKKREQGRRSYRKMIQDPEKQEALREKTKKSMRQWRKNLNEDPDKKEDYLERKRESGHKSYKRKKAKRIAAQASRKWSFRKNKNR